MRKIQIGELKFDETVYPRHNIDSHHVNQIVMAMEAGTEMPPIIVEAKTKRIVDGFHRGKAYLKLYEPTYQIDVVEKNYKDDAALFLDTIRYNSAHGLKMDTHDKAHCAIMAIAMGLPDNAIAKAMHVNEDFIGKLRVDRTAMAGSMTVDPVSGENKRGLQVPIKKTIKHMAGKTLNKAQVEANDKLSGMNQSFYVNQIITLIESRLLDTSDEKLMERLFVLDRLLDDVLGK